MQYGVNPKLSTNAHQTLLLQQLYTIFPNEKPQINTKKNVALKYPVGSYMEFDIWYPNYNIAFEFQDSYHYVTTWYNHNSHSKIQQKDDIKKIKAYKRGMDLIIVPCWWDGTVESIKDSISFHRPDLIDQTFGCPIPFNPPPDFFLLPDIPDVGELMLASFPLTYGFSLSITKNWWAGEKYDGIRYCWHPVLKHTYTRTGRVIPISSNFIDHLPNEFIDGEFWFGRGEYSSVYSLIQGNHVHWDHLCMVAFDNPSPSLRQITFEKRYETLLDTISLHHPFMKVATRILCEDSHSLKYFVENIVDDRGEGIILRKVSSFYEPGRSQSLIKLKTVEADKEGIVIGVNESSVRVQLPNGNTFLVPSEDVQVTTPCKIGSIVSFSFKIQSRRDVPISPKIFRIRTDLSWRDILLNHAKEKRPLNDSSQLKGFSSQPPGYWTKETMRQFLIDFAKKKNLDPFVADTWYITSYGEIRQSPGGRTVLEKFKLSYFHTLQKLFPEIQLEHAKFKGYVWHDITSRRAFFEKFAKDKGFDPFDPENWYSVSIKHILHAKGGGILFYYNYKLSRAISDIFPNMKLDQSKFKSVSKIQNQQVRRKFFETYARKKQFDYLIASNWYSHVRRILLLKGIQNILVKYNNSLADALIDLFPEVKFEKSQFELRPWSNVNARKRFFIEYAKMKDFEPLMAENWYSQSRAMITSVKGGSRVLLFHNNNLVDALMDLFPEIGLERSRFYSGNTWESKESRRMFFETLANSNKFDPLKAETWYTIPSDIVLSTKFISRVLSHHNNSVCKALLELFPELHLSKQKLESHYDYSVRRRFFESYAKDNGFDPRDPSNWYNQDRNKIIAFKGSSVALIYYKGNVTKALLHLFPDIGLTRSGFCVSS